MTITVIFDPPQPSNDPAVFDSKAFALLGDLNDWSAEANALAADVNSKQATASGAATTATTQAGLAADAKAAAEIAAGAALGAYDAFDDRYLGPKAADPTLDNDGNALLEGALYWNTVAKEMRAYNGAAWVMANAANAVSRSGDTMTGGLTVPSLNGGQLAGLRNKLINGNFDVWQRGTSFLGVAGQAYTADRAYAGCYGSNGNITRTVVAPGAVPQLNTGANNKLVVTGTAGNAYSALAQRIEDIAAFSGKTATFSVYCDTTKPTAFPYFRITQNFGAGGSASVLTDSNITQTVGENGDFVWKATIAVPSIAGKTIGTNPYVEVMCIWVPDVDAAAYGFYGWQAELGPVRTPFENRPYGLELALCQRYYYRLFPAAISRTLGPIAYATTTTNARASLPFPVPMRVVPSALEQSGTANHYAVDIAGTVTVCSAAPAYATSTSDTTAVVNYTVASGLTAGQAGRALSDATNGASAYLGWSAEL